MDEGEAIEEVHSVAFEAVGEEEATEGVDEETPEAPAPNAAAGDLETALRQSCLRQMDQSEPPILIP